MSTPLVTVDKDMDAEDAVKIMVKSKVRRLFITDKGKMPEKSWRLIAGRGMLGDWNWGYSDPDPEILRKWCEALKKHIGEDVLLSGGGSGSNLAKLTGTRMTKLAGKPALKVTLVNLRPSMGTHHQFSPYIGSWQISVRAVAQPTEQRDRNPSGCRCKFCPPDQGGWLTWKAT